MKYPKRTPGDEVMAYKSQKEITAAMINLLASYTSFHTGISTCFNVKISAFCNIKDKGKKHLLVFFWLSLTLTAILCNEAVTTLGSQKPSQQVTVSARPGSAPVTEYRVTDNSA